MIPRVDVTLSNKYAWVSGASPAIYEALRTEWSFFSPAARWDRRYKLYLSARQRVIDELVSDGLSERDAKGIASQQELAGWDGRIRFLKGGRLPAGIFRATRKTTEEKLGITFVVEREYPFAPVMRLDQENNTDPDDKYAFQNRCVERMLGAIKRGGGVVVAATASGKTKISGDLFRQVSCQCLFVVDQVDLLYQSQKEIAHWLGEPVGVVGDQQYTVERCTVATVQTLKKHLRDSKFVKWYNKVELVIVDELHVQMSRRNFGVLEMISPMARFGLTATLQMTKVNVRMNVWAFAGPVIFRFPIKKAVALDVVSKGQAIQVLFPEGEAIQDYHIAYDEEVVHNEAKHQAALMIVRDLIAAGRYVLLLVSRIEHLHIMDRLFADVPHGLAYGEISKDDRARWLKLFEMGKVKLLIANVVFEKGINCKRVDAIVDMAEMRSKNTVIQKYGRGVRQHADKEELIYVDFGTSTGRFRKNARSRLKALRQEEIPVKSVVIETPGDARKQVRKALGGDKPRGMGEKRSLGHAKGQKTHVLAGAFQENFKF